MGMHKSMIGKIGPGSANDTTLADYIKRKQENATQKNITFKEWWETMHMRPAFLHIGDREAEMIWNAAQGNK